MNGKMVYVIKQWARKDFKINKLILKSPTPLELVLF